MPGRARRRADRAEADLVRRAAARLRADRDRAWELGLGCEEDTRAVAALLDLLAAELPHVDPAVRRTAVEWCRAVLGEGSADAGPS